MARVLEALSRLPVPSASSRIEPVSLPAHEVAPPSPARASEVSSPAASTELPFIEVGSGPMTGSTSVLSTGTRDTVRLGPIEPAAPTVVLHEIANPALLPLSSRLAPSLVVYHQPEHAAARQYRTLLDTVLHGLDTTSGQGRVLLFSGSAAEVAVAPVVLNLALAQASAEKPRRAAVVDASITEASVHRLLGMNACPGLCEVISGAVPLHRAVRDSGVPYCQVLTAGTTGKPALAVKSLLATLAQLRKRFDLIFVEAPCWHGEPGLIELAACSDAVYLVTARAESCDALVDALPRQGIPLRGCIVAR